ncbi:uncharacterized protein CIMG_13259 [Coccidioides immitis RS]|uniref:Secreted protein n=1 Tax=Coccidioides immitis (strain RS) TaxID=246410 RepID=A0A0D8JUM0_COCIM|nr:uncharacterized protein CIMG_13259 [Coccidioides immitis RS]KJF60824.1 hypothetical protein CIMG_13259 [Coccidioides immitis RS]
MVLRGKWALFDTMMLMACEVLFSTDHVAAFLSHSPIYLHNSPEFRPSHLGVHERPKGGNQQKGLGLAGQSYKVPDNVFQGQSLKASRRDCPFSTAICIPFMPTRCPGCTISKRPEIRGDIFMHPAECHILPHPYLSLS